MVLTAVTEIIPVTRGSLTLGIRAESSRWISSLMRQFDCFAIICSFQRGGAPGSNLNGQTGLCPLKELLQSVRLQIVQRPSETEGSGRTIPYPQVPQLRCLAGV